MTDLKRRLENVLWLGGSPCAGKSSISEILAKEFNLDLYRVDEAFDVHVQRFTLESQPALTNWCASNWNERWTKPVDKLVGEVIACYEEHFSLILADIFDAPKEKTLLVEGTALLPKQVAAVLSKPAQALWMVPTADFQWKYYAGREWVGNVLAQCENPEKAFDNWMRRDERFAEWVAAQAGELNLKVLKVDGTRTIEQNATQAARYFGLDTSKL